MADNKVNDLIEKLRLLAVGNSIGTFELVALNGHSITVDRDVLLQCKYFEDLFQKQPSLDAYSVPINQETLEFVVAVFQREKELPKLSNAFEAIRYGRQIDFAPVIRACMQYTKEIRAPPDSTVLDVSLVVQALVWCTAVRTTEHYKPILVSLTDHLPQAERATVLDEMIEAIRKKNQTVDPIPLPLHCGYATVALMRDLTGTPVLAIFHDNRWMPFNLFGPKFCPVEEQVKHFHIQFGEYVVYETYQNQVLIKDLRSDEPPQLLLPSCKFFRSRRSKLHVIGDEAHGGDCLYEWDHKQKKLQRMLSFPELKLQTAHEDCSGRLIVVTEDSKALNLPEGKIKHTPSFIKDLVEDIDANGNGFYIFRTLDKSNSLRWRGSEPPIHVGETCLSTDKILTGIYKTHVWRKKAVSLPETYWEIVATTGSHGPIMSFCDVDLCS